MALMSTNARTRPAPIGAAERGTRLDGLRRQMDAAAVDAVLLGSTTSLRYFTGVDWHPSERFCGAIVHVDRIEYVAPRFELEKVSAMLGVHGEVLTWEEDESPYRLVAGRLKAKGRLGLDDQVALFMYHRLRAEIGDDRLTDAGAMINALRRQKSPAEIALMQRAKDITLEVHQRAWKQLRAGQLASEVARFIDAEHRALG